jgi:predicted nucleic acid-binding Zn ribbon protein
VEDSAHQEASIGLVAFEGGICPGCGANAAPEDASVSVTQIEATDHGWRAVGKVEHEVTFCPSCGQMFELLQNIVPVECAEYPCPRCNDPSRLTYRIVEVKKKGDSWGFTAEVECGKCQRRGIVRRALAQLGRITKLKIGPTGVEIERAV